MTDEPLKIAAPPPPKPTLDPTTGPVWLIWSNHWGRWHRRGSDGAATGYTDDIAQAGAFEYRVANAYHHPGDRDRAMTIGEVVDKLQARLSEMDAARATLVAAIDTVRAKGA